MLLIAKQRQASQTTIHAQHRRACIAVRRLGAVDWMLARDAMAGTGKASAIPIRLTAVWDGRRRRSSESSGGYGQQIPSRTSPGREAVANFLGTKRSIAPLFRPRLREKSPFASTLRHGGLSRCESSRNGGRNAGSSHRYCRRGSFGPDRREHYRAADGYRDE
jgi:hypothetical protein